PSDVDVHRPSAISSLVKERILLVTCNSRCKTPHIPNIHALCLVICPILTKFTYLTQSLPFLYDLYAQVSTPHTLRDRNLHSDKPIY
ncbi:hypothetical protein COCCADRAFT_105565, partial [Bipolaris zeicola 26-R-13]